VSTRNILLASLAILGFPSSVAIAGAPDFRGVITQPSSPFNVGNRAQLFIDRVLVRETQNVSFTQHQGKKHPRNPLLVADRTWEGWKLNLYGNVFFDEREQIFKMWYLAKPVDKFGGLGVTCFATRKDGIRWDKPLVGTLNDGDKRPNNIVANCHLASVMKITGEVNPNRQYRMTCSRPDSRYQHYTYWTMFSLDGFRWNLEAKQPIVPGFGVITCHWDP